MIPLEMIGLYLSVLLGAMHHVHVHVVHQIGHLRHVLHHLVWLPRLISLKSKNRIFFFLGFMMCCERNVNSVQLIRSHSFSFTTRNIDRWEEIAVPSPAC